MTEHVCEENIEESYESFDISESDLMKARPQPIQPSSSNVTNSFLKQFEQREERSMLEKLSESFFNQGNKVALNSDVDLIKTSKNSFAKQLEMLQPTADDKVSGKFLNQGIK